MLVHLPKTATVSDAVKVIREHGYVIIDELASAELMDQVAAELSDHVERTTFGTSDATGKLTRRTGALIARSPSARELIANRLVLDICAECLKNDTGYQLSVTEVISLWPGAEAQFIHRDEGGHISFPFPNDYEIQISTLWALSDYTEEMGATRVVPASHTLPANLKFSQDDTFPAVMPRGSVLIYSGKLYHGGGENRSDRVRQAINVNYTVAWTRQEENQYLACSPEIARKLSPELQKLMGYREFEGWGRVGDWIEPLSYLMGEPRVIDASHNVIDAYHDAAEEETIRS